MIVFALYVIIILMEMRTSVFFWTIRSIDVIFERIFFPVENQIYTFILVIQNLTKSNWQ
jgi:hypothetical protein